MLRNNEFVQEQLLAEIHNRLSEISSYLKIGVALFAKLSHDEIDSALYEEDVNISPFVEVDYSHDDYSSIELSTFRIATQIGFSKDKGLYFKEKDTKFTWPLGEYPRTAEIDEKTGGFKNTQEDK